MERELWQFQLAFTTKYAYANITEGKYRFEKRQNHIITRQLDRTLLPNFLIKNKQYIADTESICQTFKIKTSHPKFIQTKNLKHIYN